MVARERAEGIALWTSAATVVLAGDRFVALYFYGLEWGLAKARSLLGARSRRRWPFACPSSFVDG